MDLHSSMKYKEIFVLQLHTPSQVAEMNYFFPNFERGRELQPCHSQAGTKLDQTVEFQFWGTKDVPSPRVHFHTVLKAAAAAVSA